MTKDELIDRRYLRMAFIWSENSTAVRRQVGALVVKNRTIISDGYNGTPSGFDNSCEYGVCTLTDDDCRIDNKCDCCLHYRLITKPSVLHAEANAITKLAKSGNSSDGATIYVTDEPCLECSKLIIQSGIKRVVYARSYRVHDGIELLRMANIQVDIIEEIPYSAKEPMN